MALAVVVFALLTLAFAASARGLSRINVTAPIAFVAAGSVLSLFLPTVDMSAVTSVKMLAEVALALILFHDAAQVRPRQIEAELGVILRVLVVGLVLMVGLGYLAARLLLPGTEALAALLLAAALAPTDAGLGMPVVLNRAVPVRVRRALNVESGLNDGLVTPVVLFAIAGLAGQEGGGPWHALAAPLLGLVVGVVVGVGGGVLLGWSARHATSTPATRALGVLMLPALAFFGAELVEGNGYIAAFVAGTVFAAAAGWADEEHSALELTETISEPLGYAVWLVFGLTAVPLVVSETGWREATYAVVSLTVLRTVSVAVSLIGSGLRWPTVLFMGWFGPRGLVTVVFVLLSLESLQLSDSGRRLVATAVLTVLLSVVAHGLTADPLARRYGAWADRVKPRVESAPAVEPRGRRTALSSAATDSLDR